MQRKHSTFGNLLGIASFAILMASQWLHSPLHHIVDAIEPSESNGQQVAGGSEVAQGEHQCRFHAHAVGHFHGTASKSARGNSPDSVYDLHSRSDSEIPHHEGHRQNSGHDDCLVCHFLAGNVFHLEVSVNLEGDEAVSIRTECDTVSLLTANCSLSLIRGPPAQI